MSLATTVGTLNVLGDESRLRLCALLRDRELSVTDLVRITGISQSRVSTHLARLRKAGFVRDRRDGQHAFYALAAESLPASARSILDETQRASDVTLDGDRRRLEELEAEQRGDLPSSFAGKMDLHYSPGRTWQSLSAGIAGLLDLGDVLDVGCGEGAAAAYVARSCRSLTCIDENPRMVEAARERFVRQHNVQVLQADVHALPFEDRSFDAVLVFHTLTYAADPKRALEECARVLRPGGRIVVLALDAHEHRELTAGFGERHPGFSPKALRSLLTRAGFTVTFSEIACRELKKPHFQVVLSTGERSAAMRTPAKPAPGAE